MNHTDSTRLCMGAHCMGGSGSTRPGVASPSPITPARTSGGVLRGLRRAQVLCETLPWWGLVQEACRATRDPVRSGHTLKLIRWSSRPRGIPAILPTSRIVLPTCRLCLGTGDYPLRKSRTEAVDALILDAYSSDSMPIHLITSEALRLYLKKLTPHGVIMFHISHRYLDLEPVLGNIAREARALLPRAI